MVYLCDCGMAADSLTRLDEHLMDYPEHYERDSHRTADDARADRRRQLAASRGLCRPDSVMIAVIDDYLGGTDAED